MSEGGDLWTQRMKELAEKQEQAYTQYLWEQDQSRKRLDHTLTRLKRERESLMGMRDDRLVLIRTSVGARLKIYHNADRPCGQVTGDGRDRSSFRQILEGEAKNRGLKAHTCV